jgi:hypothetical protein
MSRNTGSERAAAELDRMFGVSSDRSERPSAIVGRRGTATRAGGEWRGVRVGSAGARPQDGSTRARRRRSAAAGGPQRREARTNRMRGADLALQPRAPTAPLQAHSSNVPSGSSFTPIGESQNRQVWLRSRGARSTNQHRIPARPRASRNHGEGAPPAVAVGVRTGGSPLYQFDPFLLRRAALLRTTRVGALGDGLTSRPSMAARSTSRLDRANAGKSWRTVVSGGRK